MIKEAIAQLVERKDMTQEEAQEVMGEIMRGEATPSQIGGFLTALRMKGETAEEIAGCARAMRAHVLRVETGRDDLVDAAGTGGDGTHTFNISTLAALAAAGAGAYIAKHCNRSISSRCGSADLMEALGVKIELGPEALARCINEVGIAFLFAPALHPAMKHAAPTRRELGIRTIFNILGPLTCPAFAPMQLLGVFSGDMIETMARVLGLLGSRRVLAVHGADGLDELSTTGISRIAQLEDGKVTTYTLDPRSLGLPPASLDDLRGGEVTDNADIARRILQGEKGPKRDVVLLNAAGLLVAGRKAPDFEAGLSLAAQSIDSGQAQRKLEALVEFTQGV
jgi:anthranilate phosphoribosyltransferase